MARLVPLLRTRVRARLSIQAAQAGDAVSARRIGRPDRTADGAEDGGEPAAAGGDRQPRRRRRAGGHRIRGEAAARWLHAGSHYRRLSGAGGAPETEAVLSPLPN